jgi:hypothetical protein
LDNTGPAIPFIHLQGRSAGWMTTNPNVIAIISFEPYSGFRHLIRIVGGLRTSPNFQSSLFTSVIFPSSQPVSATGQLAGTIRHRRAPV